MVLSTEPPCTVCFPQVEPTPCGLQLQPSLAATRAGRETRANHDLVSCYISICGPLCSGRCVTLCIVVVLPAPLRRAACQQAGGARGARCRAKRTADLALCLGRMLHEVPCVARLASSAIFQCAHHGLDSDPALQHYRRTRTVLVESGRGLLMAHSCWCCTAR